MTTSATPIVANTNPPRFGLVRSRVVPGNCAAGSAVVGPVFRLISGAVDVRGSRLVSISVETGPEPNFAVFRSPLSEPGVLIKAAPSERQNTSVSSASTRLHWGQRFILSSCSLLRKADFLQQLLKAGVGAQGIELRIHSQPDQPDGSLVASLFKPHKSLLVVTKSQINLCDVKGRLVLLTRLPL